MTEVIIWKKVFFGDVLNGSPLSYQLQDYHTMAYQFEAYLPLSVMNQNGDNIISFPSLPTNIGELTSQLTEDIFSKDILSFIQSLTMAMQRCNELESLTVTQSDNLSWYSSREKRLTSSKFGKIINRKSKPSSVFVKNTLLSKDLRNVRYIAHGSGKRNLCLKRLCSENEKTWIMI